MPASYMKPFLYNSLCQLGYKPRRREKSRLSDPEGEGPDTLIKPHSPQVFLNIAFIFGILSREEESRRRTIEECSSSTDKEKNWVDFFNSSGAL